MKVKVITVATHPSPRLDNLIKTLNNHNYDYTVLGLGEPWKGFGTKIINTLEHAKKIQNDYSHLIFVDAYDIIFLRGLDDIIHKYNLYYKDKIVFSTEKACWPNVALAEQYPVDPSPWLYLNSGAYMAPVKDYITLVESKPINYANDDQLYFTELFLDGDIVLDTTCHIFQSIAFEGANDFIITDTFVNNITKTTPTIIHGNGRTDMSKVLTLI